MLRVFSEASWTSPEIVYGTTLVFEGTTLLAYICRSYAGATDCAAAELCAASAGLAWVVENYPTAERVEVYTDNASVVAGINNCNQGTSKTRPTSYLWWETARHCASIPTVVAHYLRGHSAQGNPVKACDTACRWMSDWQKRGGC